MSGRSPSASKRARMMAEKSHEKLGTATGDLEANARLLELVQISVQGKVTTWPRNARAEAVSSR